MIPQMIYLALLVVALITLGARHGKPKEGVNNGYVDFVCVVLNILLMYWGGFFDVFFK